MRSAPLFLFIPLLAASMVIGTGPAQAACNVLELCSCTTSASGISFGSYDPLSSSPVDSTGTVTVDCTFAVALGGTYTISLSTGGSGSYAARWLSLAGGHLNYNLYTTNARSTIWGNGTGSQTVTGAPLSGLFSNSQIFTVYGRIPGAQNVPAGSYNDMITVTVTY